jgi:integration host factor subunit beta
MAPPIVSLTTEKAFATFRVDSMLKPELVRRVAGQSLHLDRSDVEEVVDAVLEEIQTALVRRNRDELRGFGAFAVKVRTARTGKNPKTVELVSVPETVHAFFKSGVGVRRRRNADFH